MQTNKSNQFSEMNKDLKKGAFNTLSQAPVLYRSIDSGIYFIYKQKQHTLTSISLSDFERLNLPVIDYRGYKIKFKGTRSSVKFIIPELLSSLRLSDVAPEFDRYKRTFNLDYQAESLTDSLSQGFDSCKDFISGLSFIFSSIASVGRVSNIANEHVSAFKQHCRSLASSCSQFKVKVCVKILKILTQLVNLWSEDAKSISFLQLTLEVYELFTLVNENFVAQSLDTLLIATASSLIPDSILSCLKRMHILTSRKLFDEGGLLLQFMRSFSEFLKLLSDYVPLLIKPFVVKLIEILGLDEYVFLEESRSLLEIKNKDNKCMLDEVFRTKVKDNYFKAIKCELPRFFARNKNLSDVFCSFERLYLGVLAYENTSRVEPSCFVFEGGPGCGKSITVTKLLKVCKEPHYSHTVPSANDGKDWYDSYDNQPYFYMDDIGQQGKSQWRSVINWVSCVKLPLPCADAKLKDTKYFSSEVILLTTNNLMQLSGFSNKDCIENPHALKRRCFVFDMYNVKPISGGVTSGVAVFRHFNVATGSYQEGFPQYFLDFMSLNYVDNLNLFPSGFPHTCAVDDQKLFITWVSTIVEGFRMLRKQQRADNMLDENEVKFVRDANPFMAESLSDICTSTKQLFFEYMTWFKDLLISSIGDLIPLVTNNFMEFAIGSTFLAVIYGVFNGVCKYHSEGWFSDKFNMLFGIQPKKIIDYEDKTAHLTSVDFNKVHNSLKKLSSQVFDIDIVTKLNGEDQRFQCFGILSGKIMIVPNHSVPGEEVQLVTYLSRKKNVTATSYMLVKIVYRDYENDVCLLKLDLGFPTKIQSTSDISKLLHVNSKDPAFLVFPEKLISLEGVFAKITNSPMHYNTIYGQNTISDLVTYKGIHYEGMCGIPVVDNMGCIMGFHVAGRHMDNTGVSNIWSSDFVLTLKEILRTQYHGVQMDYEIKNKRPENTSGFQITSDLSNYVPKKSNFVKTPLYGVFPITRIPANLSVYGPHTVKDLSAASREPTNFVSFEELNFARDCLKNYFVPFGDLSDREVIKGNANLARMNPKSSNGVFPLKTKEECFNYDDGTYTQEFLDLYKPFLARLKSGYLEQKDLAWCETLKDELRSIDKKEPRSFRISPVTMQVITKKCFGRMVEHIVENKWFNEIMIGLNPFSDWNKLYGRMQSGLVWAGDIKKYDKKMLVQVQQVVCDVILSFYTGDFRVEAENILRNVSFSLVVVNDDVFITTHSLPSGCWLTAIFNSLVNRCYTLMWYYRNMIKNNQKPSFSSFLSDISDPVYGDDRLNNCKNVKRKDYLNAITMCEFFKSIGMDMTDSVKGKIETPFQPLIDLTFLKRSFRYHRLLNTITCPLDLNTIYSGLSFLDGSKDDPALILQDKINNFQREIFLHEDLYKTDISKLFTFCDKNNISYIPLTQEYLVNLYQRGEYDTQYQLSYGLLSGGSDF